MTLFGLVIPSMISCSWSLLGCVCVLITTSALAGCQFNLHPLEWLQDNIAMEYVQNAVFGENYTAAFVPIFLSRHTQCLPEYPFSLFDSLLLSMYFVFLLWVKYNIPIPIIEAKSIRKKYKYAKFRYPERCNMMSRIDCERKTQRDLIAHRRKYRRVYRLLRSHINYQVSLQDSDQPFDKQSGISSIIQRLEALAVTQGVCLPDQILSRIEGMIALYFSLRDCTTQTQFMGILVLYIKTWSDRSFVETALTTIKDIFPEEESGSLDYQMATDVADVPEWLRLFKKLHTDWHLIVNNEGFKRLSKLLSMLIGMGICEASSLEFTIRGFKMFNVAAYSKHCSAVDLVDAVLSTVTFFVEGGYECIRTQSLDPLLYGGQDMQKFEHLYAECDKGSQLAKAGNLQKFMKIEPSQLECKFINCFALVRDMIATTDNIVLRRMLMDKQEKLRRMHTTFCETRIQGGLREAPFALGFFGGSGVGKSTIANLCMILLLHKNGFEASDDKIITLNEQDKFMSNYRSYINGIFIDDIGNTKADFVEKAPTAKIIELVNNVRAYANMADLDMKGKVSIEPKVVITTKNVKDACAHTYSNEPVSIARREKMVVTVKVKPIFATHGMLDPAKVEQHHDLAYAHDELIPDLWDCIIERAYPIPNDVANKPAVIGWETLTHEGRLMHDVGIKEVVQLGYSLSEDHYRQQKELVEKNNNLDTKIPFCGYCRAARSFCECLEGIDHQKISTECDPDWCEECQENHLGEPCYSDAEESLEPLDVQMSLLPKFVVSKGFNYFSRFNHWFAAKTLIFEQWSIEQLMNRLDWLENSRWMIWTNWVPEQWFGSQYLRDVVLSYHCKDITRRVYSGYVLFGTLACVCCVAGYLVSIIYLLPVPFLLRQLLTLVETEKERLYENVLADNQSMPLFFKRYRDEYVKYFTAAFTIVASLYFAAQCWQMALVFKEPQGNLAPKGFSDIVARDAEKEDADRVAREHNWINVDVESLPYSEKSKGVTYEQLSDLCFRNLCYMSVVDAKNKAGCNAFFPCSNVALIPQHSFDDEDEYLCEFSRSSSKSVGTTFKSYISRSHAVDIPDTDLCLVWIPNGGDWKDLTEYFPIAHEPSCPATFVHKTPEGAQLLGRTLISKDDEVWAGDRTYKGYEYMLPFKTYPGLCMSPLISETRRPVITSFHLAGRNGKRHAGSGLCLKEDLDRAMFALSQKPGVVLSKSSGTVKTVLYNQAWFQSKELHEKSPVRGLGEGANIKVYGSVAGRASYSSEAINTCISDVVYDVTGVPNVHGKPKFRKGDPFAVSLNSSSRPSHGVEPSLLTVAIEDYQKPILELLSGSEGEEMSPFLKTVKPLTKMETVAGQDGVRFIDKMPPKTSIGYPLGGPKSSHMTYLDPSEYEDFNCPVELDEIFWEEFEYAEAQYLEGKRYYPVFKACLKDEPTKMDKDKVRVFQCAPIVLQMLTRKYFLPIARVLSLFPLLTECSVGVNPYSPEWDSLSNHIMKYGENRILAGDYSKYDLRMPAQVMFAAFRIMIDMARTSGNYTSNDIIIMEGVATDICYPLMAFNGDLIQHYGSNPSGQNLTVYINSVVNALLFRCGYFDIYGHDAPPFREVCALQTYGDDAKSSVKPGFDRFNHINLARFLEYHDMKFTMPDKTSIPVPFMRDKDCDFLKRKNVRNKDTGYLMGALDEESIFKSLHCVLKSKALTPEQQAMQNIDGALREWFTHGRETYESRRVQMQEVASRCDLSHGCPMLNRSYDDMLDEWRERYLVETQKVGPP